VEQEVAQRQDHHRVAEAVPQELHGAEKNLQVQVQERAAVQEEPAAHTEVNQAVLLKPIAPGQDQAPAVVQQQDHLPAAEAEVQVAQVAVLQVVGQAAAAVEAKGRWHIL